MAEAAKETATTSTKKPATQKQILGDRKGVKHDIGGGKTVMVY